SIERESDDTSQRKLRGGAATEDDLDEEERPIDIKAGFSKLQNIFKKNPAMTKSLQKLEGTGTTVITKDAAAVRSYIAKNPDKVRRLSPGGKKLLISAILSSAFIVVAVILAATVFRGKLG
ncbi:hypothetical protein PHYSODRAFT_524131, partial [Phytophthora sojae]